MPIHPDPDGARRRAIAARQRKRRRAREKPRQRRWWPWLLALPLAVVAASVLAVAVLRWVDPATSAFMIAAQFEAGQKGQRDFVIAHRWVPLEAIAPWAGLAVIAGEDQKFPHHGGFDFAALEDALDTHRTGGRLRGASTVSQQLAKNLFLWSGRHWLRKGLEAWFTVLLETLLPKSRILELYLNLAEFGPGLYGVGAASEHYFGHSAATLTAAESALLAAVLPNPRRFSVAAPSPYTRARQAWIMQQMRQLGGPRLIENLRGG